MVMAGVEGLAPLNENKGLQKGEVKNPVEGNQSVVSGVTSPAPTCGTCRWWASGGIAEWLPALCVLTAFGPNPIHRDTFYSDWCPEHSPKGRAAE